MMPKETQSTIQETINVIGVNLACKAMLFKIGKIGKTMDVSHLLQVLAQSTCIGFETAMTQLTTDPTKLKSMPKAMSPLQILHDETQQAIQKDDNFFVATFKKAFEEQITKIKNIDKNAKSILDGSDFIYAVTENKATFARRTRALTTPPTIYDATYAAFSAACSTIFVVTDSVGRFTGEQLAKLTMKILGLMPESFNKPEHVVYFEQSILAMLYVYHELALIEKELGLANIKEMIYDSIYYPIFSGIMTGVYEEVAKNYPDDFPKFKDEINRSETNNGPINLTDYWNQAKSILEKVIEQARNDHEKYDKSYSESNEEEKRMQKALIKNVASNKKFLEGRRAILSLFDDFNSNDLKSKLLTVRATPLTAQSLASYSLFTASKYATKNIVSSIPYIIKTLEKQFKNLFSVDPTPVTPPKPPVTNETELPPLRQKSIPPTKTNTSELRQRKGFRF